MGGKSTVWSRTELVVGDIILRVADAPRLPSLVYSDFSSD